MKRVSRIFILCLGLLITCLPGCVGESVQEKMLRRAKEASAARKGEEQRTEKLAAAEGTAGKPAASAAAPAAEADSNAVTSNAKNPAVANTNTPPKPRPVGLPTGMDPEDFAEMQQSRAAATTALRDPQGELVRPLIQLNASGQRVVFQGDNQEVGLFNVETKVIDRMLSSDDFEPKAVGISADASRLVAGASDGSVKIFELGEYDGLDSFQRKRRTRKDAQPGRFAHEHPITAITEVSEKGLYYTGDDHGLVRAWRTDGISDEPIRFDGVDGQIIGFQQYGDGSLMLAATSQRNAVFWRVADGKPTGPAKPYTTFDGKPTVINQMADGRGLAIGDATGVVHVWTPQNDKLVKSELKASSNEITGVAFVARGKALVTSDSGGEIVRWKLPVPKERSIEIAVEAPKFVSLNAESTHLMTAGPPGFADVFDVETGKSTYRFGIDTSAEAIGGAFLSLRDGEVAVVADSSGGIHFFDQASGQKLGDVDTELGDQLKICGLGTEPRVAFYSPQGQLGIASCPTGSKTASNPAEKVVLATLADGSNELLCVVGNGDDVRIYDASTGLTQNAAKVNVGVTAVLYRNNVAVLGTKDGSLLLWDARLGKSRPQVLAQGVHSRPIIAVTILENGDIWSCDDSGSSRLTPKNVAADKAIAPADTGNSEGSGSRFDLNQSLVAAEYGGDVLLAASEAGAAAIAKDGTRVRQFSVPNGKVTTAAISHANARIAIGTDRGELWVVDQDEKVEAISLVADSPVGAVAWSGDGRSLLASDGMRTIWEIDPVEKQIRQQYRITHAISKLISWNGDRCVYLDQQGRVQDRQFAAVVWRAKDSDPIAGIDYLQATGKLIACTETGRLWRIDPATGSIGSDSELGVQQVQQVAVSKTDNRIVVLTADSKIIDCSDPASVKPINVDVGQSVTSLGMERNGKAIALVTESGSVLTLELGVADAKPEPVQTAKAAVMSQFLTPESVCVVTKQGRSLHIAPTAAVRDAWVSGRESIRDMIAMPSGDAIAIVDGSDTVEVMQADPSGPTKKFTAADLSFTRVAVDSTGTRLAAIGEYAKKIGAADTLVLWQVDNPSAQPLLIPLPERPIDLTFTPVGKRVAVALADHTVRFFSCESGNQVERIQCDEAPTSLQVDPKMTAVYVGTEVGMITAYPMMFVAELQVSETAIERLRDVGRDEGVVLAVSKAQGGQLCSLRGDQNQTDPNQVTVKLAGPDAPILATAIAGDYRTLAIAYDDPEHSIAVWKLGGSVPWGRDIEPSVKISSPAAGHSLRFVDDVTLAAGDRTGVIRMWDLASQKELARFSKHNSAVESLGLTADDKTLLSCAADRTVRTWKIPSDLNATAAAVPEAVASETTELAKVEQPTVDPAGLEEDPLDDVRQQLLSGGANQIDGEIFNLFPESRNARADVTESLESMRELEQRLSRENRDSTLSALDQLAAARREFHQNRRKLTTLAKAAGATSYSDGQENLLFSTKTAFDFKTGVHQSVKLRLDDGRYVYAARKSVSQRPEDRNGALYSWDFGYSGVQAHAWEQLSINIDELVALPTGGGVFTVPDMYLFAQDGSSREISRTARWAASPSHLYQGTRLMAIGTGTTEGESVILQMYDGSELLHQSARPKAGFSAFESAVTAIAFANAHKKVAFCVRDRTGHRLLIADAETLEVKTIQLVSETPHRLPWIPPWEKDPDQEDEDNGNHRYKDRDRLRNNGRNTNVSRRGGGAPGITSLCFSPTDDLLVAHGEYSAGTYKYSAWALTWTKDGHVNTPDRTQPMRTLFDPIEQSTPFVEETTSQPIRFVAKTLPIEQQTKKGVGLSNSSAVVIEKKGGLTVVGARTGKKFREVPFMSNQGKRPEYSITQDGQWWIMGDDRGNVEIGNLITGKTYTLTADGRPAHTGPVVGVVTSETSPQLGFPEYAVTIGEENRLKVWDLLSRLKPTTGGGSVAAQAVSTVSQE